MEIFQGIQLFNAVLKGKLHRVQEIVRANPALVKQEFGEKRTSIMEVAILKNHAEIVTWLLCGEIQSKLVGWNSRWVGSGSLWLAAEHGHLECCQAIMRGCPERDYDYVLNYVWEGSNYSVLHVAAENGQVSIINWLLSNEEGGGRALGFNAVSLHSYTPPLHLAVERGYLEACRAIVNGCKNEQEHKINETDDEKRTVLHIAASNNLSSIITWILSREGRGAGFNKVFAKKDGFTALHLAVKNGHLDACKVIMNGCEGSERGELLNGVDIAGRTALHIAAQCNYPLIIAWLLSEEEGGGRAFGFTSVLCKDGDEWTALHVAAYYGHLEACKAIVDGCRVDEGEREEMIAAVDSQECTALYYAAQYDRASTVWWLMSLRECAGGGGVVMLGASDDPIRSSTLFKALYIAAVNGHLDCFTAIVSGCGSEERMKLLNLKDGDRRTILYHATESNKPSIIAWLLSSEGRACGFDASNISALTKRRLFSPLHAAVRRSLDCVRALLSNCSSEERAALLCRVDSFGWTALHHAVKRGETPSNLEVIKELVSYVESGWMLNSQ